MQRDLPSIVDRGAPAVPAPPAPSGGSAARRPDPTLLDVAAVVYRRRRALIASVVLCVAAAAAYSATTTRIYEARAALLIEPDSTTLVNFRPVVNDDAQRDVDYYETQFEVLRSRALARKTLTDQHLWDTPQLVASGVSLDWLMAKLPWQPSRPQSRAASPAPPQNEGEPGNAEAQISAFLSALSVSRVKESRLVDIRFRSPNPALAARAANGVAQAYIDSDVELKQRRSAEASKWLSDRLAELRQQVDRREGALQNYRERTDAVSLDSQQNIVVQKLAQLNAALTQARTDRIAKQSEYEQLKAAQASGGSLESLPPVLASPLVQKLEIDLAGLLRDRAQLAQQLGTLHPDLIKADAAIAAAQARLNAEVTKVVDGVGNDFAAAEAKENALVGALDEQKQEVLNLNRQSIGYDVLKRDAQSTQQVFDGVLQRVKEAELSGELQTSNARLLDRATPPRGAVWPRTAINLTTSLFAGLFVGVGLIVAAEYLNPRIAGVQDVNTALRVPLLGITPRISVHAERLDGHPERVLPPLFRESLRTLRTRILLAPAAADIRTLAVTSTSPREGKTVVASHLAVSMALTGRRVLLVDGDIRRPRIHDLFGIPIAAGLSDLILGRANAGAAVHDSSIERLSVLPAGSSSDADAELIDSRAIKTLLADVGRPFDLVVIDCPPVMSVADATIIAHGASAVLFVVEADATHRDVAQAAMDRLAAAQANVIGVVLNKADVSRRSEYYYPYYRPEDAEYHGAAPDAPPAPRAHRVFEAD